MQFPGVGMEGACHMPHAHACVSVCVTDAYHRKLGCRGTMLQQPQDCRPQLWYGGSCGRSCFTAAGGGGGDNSCQEVEHVDRGRSC